jgi:hypothetical protein
MQQLITFTKKKKAIKLNLALFKNIYIFILIKR